VPIDTEGKYTIFLIPELTMKKNIIDPQDLACIAHQLGRSTESVYKVASRCKAFDLPEVIVTKPLAVIDKNPKVFTTVYWLTCPFLKKAVSILESEQWISRLSGYKEESMQKAHESYLEMRKNLMAELEIDPDGLSETITEPLLNTGIGGIRKGGGLKCLHLHTAHYLAGGKNPVGEMVIKELTARKLFCKKACCI
jgi:hypothetical protein